MNSDRIFFFVQSCLKYNSFHFGIWLRSVLYKPFFKKFGSNIQIKDGVTFKYPSEIELGNNCKIGEFSYFVGKGGLKIGDNLLLGAGTKIITSKHQFDDVDQPIAGQGLGFDPIEIGNDVWFGFDVKVFGNSRIGHGSVIGAGSIVRNMEIPDYSVAAGAPAKIIRSRKEN